MQLKLPRRPKFLAAHAQQVRDKARQPAGEDDPWAGEDDAWTGDDDLAPEHRAAFVGFFRGAALGAVLGLAVWGLVVFALLTWVL